MSRFKLSRRQLFGAAASTAVAGLVLARDTPVLGNVGTSAGPNDRTTAPAAAWLDSMISGEELTQARAALAPLQPKVLELDILWQWRRELAQEVGKGARAVAITRWDKAILLNGLAREAALPVRQQRIGHSLFRTEIG
jgi:hypothetical protein